MADMLKEHHIGIFTESINSDQESPNRYNKCDFSEIKVIYSGSGYPDDFRQRFTLAPARKCGDKWDIIMKFTSIMAVSGYLKLFPVIFDRNMTLVDGYQRFHACRLLKMHFWYVILDFDSNAT